MIQIAQGNIPYALGDETAGQGKKQNLWCMWIPIYLEKIQSWCHCNQLLYKWTAFDIFLTLRNLYDLRFLCSFSRILCYCIQASSWCGQNNYVAEASATRQISTTSK
jgi:hypothetical protein